MNHRITRRDAVMALAALCAGLTSCEKRDASAARGVASAASASASATPTPQATPGVTETTIKLGSFGPLSGPAAAWGAVLHGMNAYFSYVNDQGGVHGRKIEFIYRDDQYNPSKTPTVVRELVEKEGVFAIVGGIGTANGRSVADYLAEKNVPFFTPSSGDKFWSSGEKKNVYTVFPRYVTEGQILGEYSARELGAKKLAVLYQDDDFGRQGLEGVKAAAAKTEGVDVVVEVSCQPTDTDLSGQASQIAAKSPDVLILYAGPRQAVTVIKTLDAQKKKPQVVTSFVLSDPILFRLAQDSWEGTIAASAGALASGDSEAATLYREVLHKYGGGKLAIGNFTLAGFQFAAPFVQAMHKAGKNLTREAVYAALETFKDEKGPFLYWKGDDLGPPITFSKTQRLGNDKIYLVEAKGGKWVKKTDWLTAGN